MPGTPISATSFPTNPVVRLSSRPKDTRGLLIVTAGEQVGRVIPFAPHGLALTLGRGPDCAAQLPVASVSRLHARAVCIGGQHMIVDAGSTNGTFVNDCRIDSMTPLSKGDQVRLGPEISLRFSIVDPEEEKALILAAEGNERDPLTGVFGRTYLEHALDAEISRARRKHLPLSVMMIDVDRFKAVNDSHGHLAGDEVLAGLARIMRAGIRSADVLARYGGEEFVLIAPRTALGDAHRLADRLRLEVDASSIVWRSHPFRVTVSIGVASLACCSPDADRLSLLFLADQRVYLAKRSRNTVVSRGGAATLFMPSRSNDAMEPQAPSDGPLLR